MNKRQYQGHRRNADGSISEHDEQSNLFQWALLQSGVFPELRLMFAIPNAGIMLSRLPKQYAFSILTYMKKEGQQAGVPDIFLPAARGGFHGLFIEMKSLTGSLQTNQKEWLLNLEKQGYKCIVCKGFQNARDCILEYLKF